MSLAWLSPASVVKAAFSFPGAQFQFLLPLGAQMRSVTEHFVRHLFGSWLCIEAVDLELSEGRVQIAPGTRLTRGTAFGGVDLVRLLDEQWDKDRERS